MGGGGIGLAGEEGEFIMAHAKLKMFIRHQGRDILLVAGNLGLELREVWWKLRDNGSWSWNMELVVESVSMNKSSWKV